MRLDALAFVGWLALIGLALGASACGPAVHDYSVVESPSGAELKLEEIAEILRPDGQTALLMQYRTDLELDDVVALESEIADAWEYLRPFAETRHLRVAVIQASHWQPPSWQRRGAAARYVVERGDRGAWAARPDMAASEPSS